MIKGKTNEQTKPEMSSESGLSGVLTDFYCALIQIRVNSNEEFTLIRLITGSGCERME